MYSIIKRIVNINDLLDFSDGTKAESNSISIYQNECKPNETINADVKYNPNPNYGKFKTEYINFTLPLFNNSIDIGIYQTFPYIEFTGTTNDLPDPIVRKIGVKKEAYYTTDNYFVEGQTESRIDEIDFYGQPIINANYSPDANSFTGFLNKNILQATYVINGEFVNTYIQNTGVKYTEYFQEKRIVFNSKTKEFEQINLVNFKVKGQGWNENNLILEELVKDDKLFGITEIQDTKNNLNIQRADYSVFYHHYILGEVNSLDDLVNYKNNYFNLT